MFVTALYIESLFLRNRSRYGNMNDTMLSQIVCVIFLTHQLQTLTLTCGTQGPKLDSNFDDINVI